MPHQRLRALVTWWREGGNWPRVGVASALALSAYSCLAGPRLYGDSESYLANSPFRPPLYPLLLDGMELLFGTAFLRVTVAFQVMVGVAASYLLTRRLASLVGSSSISTLLVLATAILPHIYYGRDIMTESLSFTVLCTLALLLLDICQRGLQATLVFRSLLATAVLMLLRVQFAFLIPVAGLLLLLAILRGRGATRTRLVLGAIGVASGAVIVQAGYTYAGLGRPTRVAATGVQLLTVVAYNSRQADVAGIEEPRAREYASLLIRSLHEARLLSSDRGSSITAHHFAYNRICYRHVIARYREWVGDDHQLTGAELIAMDGFTSRVALGLLRGAWPRYAAHIATIVHQVHKYFAILAGLLGVLGAIAMLRVESRLAGLLLVGATTNWWVNVLIVSAVEYPQTRYTFYFDSILICVVLALISRSLPTIGATAAEHKEQGAARFGVDK